MEVWFSVIFLCFTFFENGLSIGYVPKSATKTKKMETTQSQPTPKHNDASFREPEQSNPQPNVDPGLDTFKELMDAMDAELSRRTSGSKEPLPHRAATNEKGKGKEHPHVVTESEGIEAAMEAELKAALERGDDDGSEDENEPMDYNLIKNFLESFKSQAGLSGPVSNLAGRLQPGFKLPRDDS